MSDFFATIYEVFGLYSTDLAEHLRGYDLACQDYTGTNLYVLCGFIMLGINFLLFILYYYVIDKPNFSKILHWCIVLLLGMVINFLVAFGYSYTDLSTENFCPELTFSSVDCLGYGIMNAILSAIVFFIYSAVGKWGSNNCRKTPF